MQPTFLDVARNVRVTLATQQRSAASVARDIGMPPRQFRQRTRGEVEFTAAEIAAVARALGVTADSLLVSA